MAASMLNRLLNSYGHGAFSGLELSYCRLVEEFEPLAGYGVLLAVALAVKGSRLGEVCLSLDEPTALPVAATGDAKGGVGLPPLDEWIGVLRSSALVGRPGEFKPFILDDANRFYLYRHWENEQRLAALLSARLRATRSWADRQKLLRAVGRVFSDGDPGVTDWQKVAAVMGLSRDFCVISGGPGTGKTFTAVKLAALIQEIAAPLYLQIGLAAPTGKAAARLTEAVRKIKPQLRLAPEVIAQIPERAMTIHRLIGSRESTPHCRYGPDNQLPLDVLIVDESSMVDQALMCKLLEAVSPRCRLVLLGDKNQLASVEPGRVLGDICAGVRRNCFSSHLIEELGLAGVTVGEAAGKREVNALGDSVVLLERNFRFAADSSMAGLAAKVEEGDQDGVMGLLLAGSHQGISWCDWQEGDAVARLSELLVSHYQQYLRAATAKEALEAFDRFRLLCVHRGGRYGVAAINGWVENLLSGAGLVTKAAAWYRGRPVMVTRNNYGLGLFNGDVGITFPDEAGDLRVYFATADGGCRGLAPARLFDCETTYAMTVHKSQGSEYEHVALLLPDEPSAVLNRELLYTAVTRARKSFGLWGGRQELAAALAMQKKRITGLRELLWPEGECR